MANATDLREMTDDELEHELAERRQELFNLRFQAATGAAEQTAPESPSPPSAPPEAEAPPAEAPTEPSAPAAEADSEGGES